MRNYEGGRLLPTAERSLHSHRTYPPAAVRDAHLVHQLRRGGYLLRQIAPVVAQVQDAGGVAALEATLGDWRARLTDRGLAMLTAAAELSRYVEAIRSAGVPGGSR